jgi:hypothetical protein
MILVCRCQLAAAVFLLLVLLFHTGCGKRSSSSSSHLMSEDWTSETDTLDEQGRAWHEKGFWAGEEEETSESWTSELFTDSEDSDDDDFGIFQQKLTGLSFFFLFSLCTRNPSTLFFLLGGGGGQTG